MSNPTVKPLTLTHPAETGEILFRWGQDRFDHQISLAGASVCCVEEAEDQAWPDSPPIQQLSIESIDGKEVALGVGCAGTSHWSLSVEPIDGGFRFDWACRAKDVPEQLGAKYTVADAIRFQPNEGTDASTTDAGTILRPEQAIEQAGTYRWRYDVVIA